MFREWKETLCSLGEEKVGIVLTDRQAEQFCEYGELLLAWNEKMNLTAITEPQEVIIKHFVDSLVLVKMIHQGRLADVGTGAGFPGIPLKIMNPELDVVLVDSLAKRLEFLNVVIQKLQLTDIVTVHSRAEDAGRDPRFREKFDCVTARAVARLPVLLELCLPLVKKGGECLLAKGPQAFEEIKEAEKALELLGGSLSGVKSFNLAEGAEHRTVVVVKKVAGTPAQYPRRAGTPEKKPL